MKFSYLASYFGKIEKTTSRLKITELLADFFKKLTPEEIEKTVYLLQGRVSPLYEKKDFGLAERLVIKSCCLALNIENKFFESRYKKIGDLGETILQLKKEFSSLEEKDFTILEVFEILLKITEAQGEGSQEYKVNLLADLLRRSDPLSCKYLVRIPLGVLRLGFSDMTILDSYSWMVSGDKKLRGILEKSYHVRPNLGYIGRLIKEKGIEAVQKISPKLFTPIIMMRAERLSSGQEIIHQIGECLVEPKFDGFRLQVHYQKKTGLAKLFSRSLEEVSYMYPDIIEGIKKQIEAEEVVLEGEAIGYDVKKQKFLPFQETVQRKRKYAIEEMAKKIPLKFFCFELLYKNGKNFLNEPFILRRRELEKTIKTNKDLTKETIFLAEQTKVNQAEEIDELFEKYIGKDLEGLIAKKINGVYKPGAREWNWIKYKKSYSSKIKDTIDCLVMGYDLGKGKRASFGIGAFLVGVYDEKHDQYLTVAKIGTGLTDEEWRNLKKRCDQFKIKEKPKNYLVDKLMYCDIWLTPALVVEIRADEITRSPVHTAGRKTDTSKKESLEIINPGFALRFPRLERFREDKNPYEVTTLSEIERMFQNQQKAQ